MMHMAGRGAAMWHVGLREVQRHGKRGSNVAYGAGRAQQCDMCGCERGGNMAHRARRHSDMVHAAVRGAVMRW